MEPELANEAQLRAARQLALHLRQNPEDAQRPPEELAEQFGLPATFVENVISGVQGPVGRGEPWFPKIDLSFIVRGYRWVDGWFNRLTENPVLFVVATTVLCIVIAAFSGASTSGGPIRRPQLQYTPQIVALIAAIVTLTLHLTCFYKRRMVRYALVSGLALWVMSSVTAMIAIWFQLKDGREDVIAGVLLAVALGMMVVFSIYSAIGAGAAILGAYMELLRHNLREDRMSRQELLEHYFHLQERLDASEGLAPRPGLFDSEFVKALMNTGPFWALLIGVFLRIITIVLQVAAGMDASGSGNPNWAEYANLVMAVVVLIAYVLAGFFAKNVVYGLVQSFALSVGGLLAVVVGVTFFNVQVLGAQAAPYAFFAMTVGNGIVSFFGALGGLVQRRAAKELNLAQNDPASILAEMVRIQWRLSDRRSSVCVMVVDAAKSSEMKAYADPLAVEYSFREYQNLLLQLSRELSGRVHSTAGDGAVIAFSSAVEAFMAAKRIQTDIERFNREDNRLQLPFRLRVGLHMGEIVGDLEEVEFTEVIDIAAHVQAAAPVGGIAVTDSVAEHLPIEEFIPLAKQIDGQNVLLALNPTVDQPWQTRST